jgi:hypothetical protein
MKELNIKELVNSKFKLKMQSSNLSAGNKANGNATEFLH